MNIGFWLVTIPKLSKLNSRYIHTDAPARHARAGNTSNQIFDTHVNHCIVRVHKENYFIRRKFDTLHSLRKVRLNYFFKLASKPYVRYFMEQPKTLCKV